MQEALVSRLVWSYYLVAKKIMPLYKGWMIDQNLPQGWRVTQVCQNNWKVIKNLPQNWKLSKNMPQIWRFIKKCLKSGIPNSRLEYRPALAIRMDGQPEGLEDEPNLTQGMASRPQAPPCHNAKTTYKKAYIDDLTFLEKGSLSRLKKNNWTSPIPRKIPS